MYLVVCIGLEEKAKIPVTFKIGLNNPRREGVLRGGDKYETMVKLNFSFVQE